MRARRSALAAAMVLLQSSCGLRPSYLPRRGQQLYASLPSPSSAATDSESVMQLLQDEGITKESVLRFTHDCTISVAETRAVLGFLQRIVGSRCDVPKILASCPRILARNVSDLQPTYDFLVLLYGKETAERAIVLNPHLLCVEVEDSPAPAEEFLLELGVTQAALKRIQKVKPHFLYLSVEHDLRGKIEYLDNVLGSCSAVARFVSRFPDILGLSTEANVRPSVEYLERCGVQNIEKVLTRHPQILGYSVEKKIRPTVEYLQSIGVVRIGRVIEIAPSVLGLSLEDNIAPKVAFFDGMGIESWMMLEAHPTAFTLNLDDNIRSTVRFLIDDVGLPNAEREIERNPSILGVSVEFNLKPTADYLASLGYDLRVDLRARHLAASLTGRIIPRFEFLKQEGYTKLPKLAALTTQSDRDFCATFSLDRSAFDDFRAALTPRVKFAANFDRWVKTGRSVEE